MDNDFCWSDPNTLLLGYPILGIWYWCTDQTIVQNILAAKTEKDGRDGAIFGGFLKILPVFIMVMPGVLAFVLFQDEIGSDHNSTLLVVMQNLLPKGLLGLFAAGLLAALMSTIEAALNSTATLASKDILAKLKPDVDDRTQVLVGRVTAAVVIVLAMLWSTQGGKFTSIFEAINKIPMIFAPAITTIFLLGVFWKKGTKEAAITTLLFNVGIGIVYMIVDIPLIGSQQLVAEVWGLPFMLAGGIIFILCLIVYIAVSLYTTAPAPETLHNLTWEHPLDFLTSGKVKGVTDPRIMAGLLLAIMLVLYLIMG